MTSYKGRDDCTDIILDFIAGGVPGNPRGESGGNYSAYFGHIHGTVPFDRYTLEEIYRFQETMLHSDPRSTALGRYQFIERTLKGLQRSERLPDSTKLTPALQDRLAVELLVNRGYTKWWRGQITDAAFAHNLSLEWASLPDPEKDGRSHYDGDGVNSASTTLDHVYDMLIRARAAQQPVASTPAATPSAQPARPPSHRMPPRPKDDPDNSANDLNRAEADANERSR